MNNECAITQSLLLRQRTMFRIAETRGFSQKIIHLETGMSLSAIGQYARGETTMGGPAIIKLAGMEDFPSDLLTVLFEGTGRMVTDEPVGVDLDTLGCETADFTAEYIHAKQDGVVTPIERDRLRNKAARIAQSARAVAA